MVQQVPYLLKIHIIHAPSGVNICSFPQDDSSHNPQLVSGMLSALFAFFEEEVGGNVTQINLMDFTLIVKDYLDLKIVLEVSSFTPPTVQEIIMNEFISSLKKIIKEREENVNRYVHVIENSDLQKLLDLEEQEYILQKKGLVNYFDTSLLVLAQANSMVGYTLGKEFSADVSQLIPKIDGLFHEVHFRTDSDEHTNYILREDLIWLPNYSCLAVSLPHSSTGDEGLYIYLIQPKNIHRELSEIAHLLIDFFRSNFRFVIKLKIPPKFYLPSTKKHIQPLEFKHHLAVGFSLLRPVINEVCEAFLLGIPVVIVSDPFSQEEILRLLDFIIPEDYLKNQIVVSDRLPEKLNGNKLFLLPRRELADVVSRCKNYVEIGNYVTASLPRSQYLEKVISIRSDIPIVDVISFYNSVLKDIERSVRGLVLLTSGVYSLDDSALMYFEFKNSLRDKNHLRFVEKVFVSRFWPNKPRLQELKRLVAKKKKHMMQMYKLKQDSANSFLWTGSHNAPSKR